MAELFDFETLSLEIFRPYDSRGVIFLSWVEIKVSFANWAVQFPRGVDGLPSTVLWRTMSKGGLILGGVGDVDPVVVRATRRDVSTQGRPADERRRLRRFINKTHSPSAYNCPVSRGISPLHQAIRSPPCPADRGRSLMPPSLLPRRPHKVAGGPVLRRRPRAVPLRAAAPGRRLPPRAHNSGRSDRAPRTKIRRRQKPTGLPCKKSPQTRRINNPTVVAVVTSAHRPLWFRICIARSPIW